MSKRLAKRKKCARKLVEALQYERVARKEKKKTREKQEKNKRKTREKQQEHDDHEVNEQDVHYEHNLMTRAESRKQAHFSLEDRIICRKTERKREFKNQGKKREKKRKITTPLQPLLLCNRKKKVPCDQTLLSREPRGTCWMDASTIPLIRAFFCGASKGGPCSSLPFVLAPLFFTRSVPSFFFLVRTTNQP